MDIYCRGVKTTINGHEEVLAFEILVYTYLPLLENSINRQALK